MNCLYPPPLALLPRLNLFGFRVHSNPWRGPGAISFLFRRQLSRARAAKFERRRGRGHPATSTMWRYIYAGAGAGREGLGQEATEKPARKRSLFNQRQPAVGANQPVGTDAKQAFIKRIARPPWGHPGICNETRVPVAIEICSAPPIAPPGRQEKTIWTAWEAPGRQERINWTACEAPGRHHGGRKKPFRQPGRHHGGRKGLIAQPARHQGGTREAGKDELDSPGSTREAGQD